MSSDASKEESTEWANRVLDARIFKAKGVSPNSRWAKNYSKMMREPLKPEEWRAFQEKLKDTTFAEEWMDKVISGWHRRRTSVSSRQPSNRSRSR
jgi:hypothetical protein